jgi:probable DNA metabolism protein
MIAAALREPDDFDEWRDEARRLVAQGVAPEHAAWRESEEPADLFATPAPPPSDRPREVRANRTFLDLARSAVLHADPARLALLYRVLWRLQEFPRLMEDATDRDVGALQRLASQVRRDIHKMRAFVRFRSVADEDGERYVAWFEPEHRIERANAEFFVNRFASQRWSILTPRLSLHWDGATLLEGPAAQRGDAPSEDATEELWLGYYRSIFNPARLKVGMMLKEMPRRYWKNLPEARQIPALIAGAQQREAAMIATGTDLFAQEVAPASLAQIGEGIAQCRRCAIGCNGTRAVRGEGPFDAELMVVGEQPGDTEGLRHQCGQTFQVRATGQAPPAPDADGGRDRLVPVVARRRAGLGQAARYPGAGRQQRARIAGAHPRDRARARQGDPAARWHSGVADRASELPSASRWRGAGARTGSVCGGSGRVGAVFGLANPSTTLRAAPSPLLRNGKDGAVLPVAQRWGGGSAKR